MSHRERDSSQSTVTLLFTDIEGSTRRWQQYPEKMKTAVARHDAIMRRAIGANGGRVFKTIGDAFCAAFPSPASALLAAVDAQRMLSSENWGEVGPIRVRMAIHSGVGEQIGSDYVGPAFYRTARLLATGHGGQILVSTATRAVLHGKPLPGDTTFRDLGEHRLKDFSGTERIYQCLPSGVPEINTKLNSQPSPWHGVFAAPVAGLFALAPFAVASLDDGQSFTRALTPMGLYRGLKSLAVRLSTTGEWTLLAVAALCILFGTLAVVVRRRRVRLEERLAAPAPRRVTTLLLNQRTIAFAAGAALIALLAWGYQQYLWRVALPIPENAIGFALTRDASAATLHDGLADALFAQGQTRDVVVRELPVRFDGSDTEQAREFAERIGAEATIIYRVDHDTAGVPTYVAYLVFTDPSVGLIVQGDASPAAADPMARVTQSPVARIKDGVDVPLIRTDSLTELIDAAAGILAYNDDRIREAIEHLELALPTDPGATNGGIVSYYLGNAYGADFRDPEAMASYGFAAAHYEARLQSGESLPAQDLLLYVKTVLAAGRLASGSGDYDSAAAWLERGDSVRDPLLAVVRDLERPGDAHATYARLYGELADVYRFEQNGDKEQFWRSRAEAELDALAASAAPKDARARIQESGARFALGDCVGAIAAAEAALRIDPDNVFARFNIASVASITGRDDLARARWAEILALKPDDIGARQQIVAGWTQTALNSVDGFYEPSYLDAAEQQVRDILALDPTNLDARRKLASIWEWRATSATMDMSAALRLDDIALEVSQALWDLDPVRRQTAIDAYDAAIHERRILALELLPGDTGAALDLAVTHARRHAFLFAPLYRLQTAGETALLEQSGEILLADGRQVQEWTARVLANGSGATRPETLAAWGSLMEVLEREWSWYSFYAPDPAMAAQVAEELRVATEQALLLVDTEPAQTNDELGAIGTIYYEAFFYYALVARDDTKTTEIMGTWERVSTTEIEQSSAELGHMLSLCAEERERVAGDALFVQEDYEGAITHYGQALAVNPDHIPSRNNLGAALYELGRTDEAIAQTELLLETDPGNARGWSNLALYHTAAGNAPARDEALARLFALLAERPAQARLAVMHQLLEEMRDLPLDHPEEAESVLELLPRMLQEINAIALPAGDGFALPLVYGLVAETALLAGDGALAEAQARRALELDPHRPFAHAVLVLAVLHQGRDAAPELEAAIATIGADLWSNAAFVEPADLAVEMTGAIDRFTRRYPDDGASATPFLTALQTELERVEAVTTG